MSYWTVLKNELLQRKSEWHLLSPESSFIPEHMALSKSLLLAPKDAKTDIMESLAVPFP